MPRYDIRVLSIDLNVRMDGMARKIKQDFIRCTENSNSKMKQARDDSSQRYIWDAHFNCGCDAINTSGALVMFDGIRHNVGVPRNWRHLLEWINGFMAIACSLLGLLSSISSAYSIKHTSLGKHFSPWPIGLVCWVICLLTTYLDLRFFWYGALLDDVDDD